MKKESRPRLSGNKLKAYNNLTASERRILVVGDIHAPFQLPNYLDFCLDVYAKHNLNQCIFIGDLIDNHYASYHETDPNGYSGGEELSLAIKEVQRWYKAFPIADVIIGNHDRMIARKAQSSNVPREWLKSYNDVLGTPKWKWTERVVYDNVQYIHGEGGQSSTKARSDMMSTVQGHIHTKAGVEYFVGQNFKIFACQSGCGIDRTSFSMGYAKNFRKQAIGCAVVLGGHTAFNCMMEL